MATPSRSAVLGKMNTVLKKHYKPIRPTQDRPLLEQLLFACCLENSTYEAAEQAYTDVDAAFFDLNETRVSSVKELAEVMKNLHDPVAAATNFKRVLQSVFETHYAFDLEKLKKATIGQAVKDLGKLKGVTPFAIAYATQHSFGGHAIPTDRAALETLHAIGAITREEANAGESPGLERAIAKNKGIDFASMLHQLAVDFWSKPFAKEPRDVILSIAPDAKERFPKRTGKKEKEPAAEAPAKSEKKKSRSAATTKKKSSAAGKATAQKSKNGAPAKRGSGKGLSKAKPR